MIIDTDRRHRIIDAVQAHPLAGQMRSQPWRRWKVLDSILPTDPLALSFSRTMDPTLRAVFTERSRVTIVTVKTAPEEPDASSVRVVTYRFVLDPDSLVVLHAAAGAGSAD